MKKSIRGSLIDVDTESGPRCYLTLLPIEMVQNYGLPLEFIVAEVTKKDALIGNIQDSIISNPRFSDTLNEFCAEKIPTLTEFKQHAMQQDKGWIYLVDQRTADPSGRVPPEDILGGFEVFRGIMRSFVPNNKHKLITDRGMFDLGDNANKALEDYLVNKFFAETL